MKTKLTLVALAVLSVNATAANFSVPLDIEKDYACKRCVANEHSNSLGVMTEQSTHLDSQYGANADIRSEHFSIDANNAGADNGHLKAAAYYGDFALELAYVDRWNLDDNDIGAERKQLSAGAKYQNQLITAFVKASSEDKQGQRISSVVDPKPTNYLETIDHTTQVMNAGVQLHGDFWNLGVAAFNSDFTDNAGVDADNSAQQASVKGGLNFGTTRLSVSAASGKMIQDDAIEQENSLVPIANFDGEVETLDYNARISSRFAGIKLNGFYRYSDRDNVSGSYPFFDAINTPIDTSKTQYGFDASYRLGSVKFSAGFEQNDRTRSDSDREETQENELFARVEYRLSAFNSHIKFTTGERTGSDYRIGDDIFEKYYLADRDRLSTELGLGYSRNNYGANLKVILASDDYSNSSALKKSDEVLVNLDGFYRFNDQLVLNAYAGTQTIDSLELHNTEIADEFSYFGFGLEQYQINDDISVGSSYTFSFSGSDTSVDSTEMGDYYQYQHLAEFHMDYRINTRFSTRLAYTYERHYDTNYANQPIESINSIADLNQNYTDHKIGAFFTIKL
ncbi:MtrB/PioB family outer membrane beta-barrel protein [Shewanella fidelis]|uniref:MtrB/PioB family outer membrane beta-barrel protein n=1 Tax=Shewanella fidelis TaxID=173509 RepID=A0AAW8NSD2_9GAMM|nr:MtrB/PioB family outer membrane beta-barrel protein [Shewanella fidelis]MDR8525471.1 MtrB/PioB family outer membrane beta-barrel protein [Shewanella fidelis]MDW4813210.1 MtrB/PioB family outer membrane beta-barrel protein [Shewanella fidelis]MDW4816910.1 MtrB/PioB family outer membrane beta-barrel protein [Shewanella fidelis]MDW4820069.1 MtrB/PioB family outer membrane beta-barrel protein [Shewanella fidelis]MDW4825675.1 MtrB/PioB family outer membrane beta-barrel protein [Shewanella fideli